MASVIEPGFLLGLMLLTAMAAGYVAHFLRIPRVVGYVVGGVVLHQLLSLWGHSEDQNVDSNYLAQSGSSLSSAKDVALGMILFALGNVFEASHIRRVGKAILRISLTEIGCVLGLVFLGCTIAYLAIGRYDPQMSIGLGLLLGIAAVATAPAATIHVLQEYQAKGLFADTISSLTALNNIAALLLFYTALPFLAAMGMLPSVLEEHSPWTGLLFATAGSMILGTVLGFVLSVLYTKIATAEFVLIFLAALLGLGFLADFLSHNYNAPINPLLIWLICGAIFSNVTSDQEPLHKTTAQLGAPIFAVFFVLAGFELHLNDLLSLGAVGAAYVVLRITGKCLGSYWASKRTTHHQERFDFLGLGLLCQAGVAIALADTLCVTLTSTSSSTGGGVVDPCALEFKSLILGSVVIFELTGPLALKTAAIRAGEVKALTLLRRLRTNVEEGDSITRRTWQALLRIIGLSKTAGHSESGPLLVQHIMRANIKMVPASADLDEVLHFVERSRFNHFPVVHNDGTYYGMIRFADLRDIIYDPSIRDLVTAWDMANPRAPVVTVRQSLEELTEVFGDTDLDSLAVIESTDNRKVVGLVEQRDLLRALRGGSKTSSTNH